MTGFEAEIAAFFAQDVRHLLSCAVRGPSPGGAYLAVCNCGRDDALALRVAAAIDAAVPGPVNMGDAARYRLAALTALHGGA